ncbi:hypothetical protein ACOJBM_29075 [Rhizobium beringeri]|jgi:methyl-accepting chemotaxis protein|uniref:hypothetical protein n=1 Tax=Rhizobium TaxID=379 RepID=UPI0018D58B51|nr:MULTISPECIES: hypothetical protein [Rhizobium]WSG74066.1 hypothetical protein U8P80_22585 [Rhizobium beringeri]WSH14261.1 hypothetical protein U8P74_22585 [Rhizobium beringeri]WSH27069.1 hypothetical protein U8P75_22545 [Rhizobium beringeri]WSH50778.1 hypothetical protein U8Q06_22460 [Rhizobium beringeri]WSH79943.1 hypothetical protein U8P69_22375 [Rhizobium beringeri]
MEDPECQRSAGRDRLEEIDSKTAWFSSEIKNLRNLVSRFRFGQHSFANVVDNRNDASPSAKPSRGMKAKLGRANGGASASALAYDSWEEF